MTLWEEKKKMSHRCPEHSIKLIRYLAFVFLIVFFLFYQGKLEVFAQHLADWVGGVGFKEVVVLSGVDAAKRLPEQMEGYVL